MKIQPLGDRVVLQYKKAEESNAFGIVLPDSAKEKPQEAVVVAVGEGTSDHKMFLEEGDRVICSKYAGTEIKLEDEEYTIVSQENVIAKVE